MVKRKKVDQKVESNSISNSNSTSVSEIDELFGALKKIKSDLNDQNIVTKKKKKNFKKLESNEIPVERPPSVTSNKGIPYFVSPEAPVHRIDNESGLPVYKAHILKVG
jgi:hypothetical protein